MTEEWWNKVYESAALDMHDAYVQRLLNEFRYLSEKAFQTQTAPGSVTTGDETS